MKFDKVSTKFLKISFSLNSYNPGLVSEYWGCPKLQKQFTAYPILLKDIPKAIKSLQQDVCNISDNSRKQYLLEQTKALQAVCNNLQKKYTDYASFLNDVLGLKVKKVSTKKIDTYKDSVVKISKNIGIKPQDFYSYNIIKTAKLKQTALHYIDLSKQKVINKINHPSSESIKLSIVSKKPWQAFNKHYLPFKSKISINTDTPINECTLKKLIVHETYGGHHTELSIKDKYLKSGFGEHSIINIYSPQTLISEGIAENANRFFNVYKETSDYKLAEHLSNLNTAVSVNATFLYYVNKWSDIKLINYYQKYTFLSNKEIKAVIDFIKNEQWGKYTPWYYYGKSLVLQAYNNCANKDKFIKTIYTKPTSIKYLLTKV